MKHGLLAEFAGPQELISAAEKMRDAKYQDYDCHSPFPIHGMDAAMGLKKSILGWIAFCAGLTGCSGAMFLQWWTSTQAYPMIISGKPFFSFQAFIPVTFELTILLTCFGVVLGMFGLNRLPTLHHPVFYSDRFKKATDDGFFVSVEDPDGKLNYDETSTFLKSIGATHVEVLEE